MTLTQVELSSTTATDINLPYITADATGPKHMSLKMTRAKLESLTNSLIERTREPCKKCLKDADISPSDIKVHAASIDFGFCIFWWC
jgi:molecular chaperone DnaK